MNFRLLLFFAILCLEPKSEDEKALQKYLKTKPTALWRDKPILVFSIAPIRSHPKQSYNATEVSDDPEGSDVPMQLMERKTTKEKEWEALKQQLVKFGKSSGTVSEHRDCKSKVTRGFIPTKNQG